MFVLLSTTTYMIFLFQFSAAPKNYRFVRWVDPPPIIHIRSTSNIYRLVSSILKEKWATIIRTMKRMTTAMVVVHRRNYTIFYIATAPVTRTRGLWFPRRRRRHHHHHHLQWADTLEKVQFNLLCGATTRSGLSCYIHVFVAAFSYLRHVRFSPGSLYPCSIEVLTWQIMCYAC